MLPAPGQGALALQTRMESSVDIRTLVRALHDPVTAAAVTAERMFLQALGGGCGEPIAAYAEVDADNLLQTRRHRLADRGNRAAPGQTRPAARSSGGPGVDLAVEISR